MWKTVNRMCQLWFRHAKFFRNSVPYFPKSFKSKSIKTFMLFRDRQLREALPPDKYFSLSSKQRESYFRKYIWKGRKVRHYDYYVQDGEVHLDEEEKIFPRRKKGEGKMYWTTKDGKLKDSIKEALLIKPSKTCLFKGLTPFPLGSQPQKLVYNNEKFYDFLASKPDMRKHYDSLYHDRVSVSGSWGSQYKDFQKLCDPVEHEVTYKDYTNAVLREGDKLCLPKLVPPTLETLSAVKTNPKANSGLVSSRLFGTKHAEADRYMLPIAKKLFTLTGADVSVDTSCWFVGGRNRRQKLGVNKTLRSRSLLVPEGPNKILGLAYAQPFYDAMAIVNWQNYESEIRLGNNDFHGNYFKYDEYMNKPGKVFVEADISCHDGNTIEETMVVAFGILRSCYPPSKIIDRHFLYFMSGFIYKNVAVPGRFVYKCLKGIPTGSPFTSAIVSIVNWLNWRSFLYKHELTYRTDTMLHVFGDDTLVRFGSLHKDQVHVLSEDWWKVEFKKFIGHDLDPVHLKVWNGERDEAPTFLKTYSNFGLPARHPKDTILSATIVRKSNNSYGKYADVVKGLCYAGPYDFDGYEWLEQFRTFLLDCRAHTESPLHLARDETTYASFQKKLRITYRGVNNNYLVPLILGYEVAKNVDLGAKPKDFMKGGYHDDRIVTSIINEGVYNKRLTLSYIKLLSNTRLHV